jgi:hypothetical protein
MEVVGRGRPPHAESWLIEDTCLRSPDGIGFEEYAGNPPGVCIWKGMLAAMDTLQFDLTAKAVAPPR